MRFALALLSSLFLSGLVHAQANLCSGCPRPETRPLTQGRAVCLSGGELAARIATSKAIGPPGMNESHMNSHGTVMACLCFNRTGRVTDVGVLSGPAMMQQPVLEFVKDWAFRPIARHGHQYGGCGTLRIRVDMDDSQVKPTIER